MSSSHCPLILDYTGTIVARFCKIFKRFYSGIWGILWKKLKKCDRVQKVTQKWSINVN